MTVQNDTEMVPGMSGAFSGPSRDLGIEHPPGSGAFFGHGSQTGGIQGRSVVLQRRHGDSDGSKLETVALTTKDFEIGIAERASFSPDRRQALGEAYLAGVESDRFAPLADAEDRVSS